MTRLEKIRSMNAEELAHEIFEILDENEYDRPELCRPERCHYFRADGCCDGWKERGNDACIEACVKWLNEEIDDTEE